MNKIHYFLLFLTIPLLFSNCKKEDDEPKNPIEFSFVLLNEDMEETTEFEEGKNITFSFQGVNKTSDDLFIENFFPNDDFFRVYQPDLTSEGIVDYGVPYLSFALVGSFFIFKGEDLKIDYLWNNNTNMNNPALFGDAQKLDLPKGRYYTEFSQVFHVGNIETGEFFFKTEEKQFKIEFTVK